VFGELKETRTPFHEFEAGFNIIIDLIDPGTRVLDLGCGTGTLLQALLDAATDPGFGAHVVAVGADRDGIAALQRAEQAGVATFVLRVSDFATRADWDAAFTAATATFEPDLVVLAGFMKLAGPHFLARFGGRCINSHPALLPSFAGMHAARDALEHGVKVSGATLFLVDAGVDTGPILAQVPVEVHDDDDAAALHERIKTAERALLVDVVGRMARLGWTQHGRKVTIP